MNNIFAFVDEFGNNSFDFKTQGSHFIVAAIICKESDIDELKLKIEEIRSKHFQKGEIKSSKVGPNHARRKKILSDIVKLNFGIFAVVIDKRLLIGKGFQIKKSFYKYLNNLLYKELFRTYPKLELHVDQHGGNDYMIEFQKYVLKHHQRDLFSGSEFYIANSEKDFLIQLADFIAGTLGYIYDETKKSENSNDYFEILEPFIAGINLFPRKFSFDELVESNMDESFDPQISSVSYQRINAFLESAKADDQQTIDQINFLNLLLLFQRANAKSRYLTTSEIFGHLYRNRQKKVSEEYFRSKVVGDLRDQGIIIASCRDGYKIPTCARDLYKFVNHGKRIVIPMLNRIKEARKAIKLATGSDLDILSSPEYSELKTLLDN